MPHTPSSFQKCSVLLSLLVIMCFSCEKEEVKKVKDFTVTIDATQGDVDTYYLLSDEEGNVVDLVYAGHQGTFELKPSAPYRYDTYSLTEITISDSPVQGALLLHAKTYAGINSESITWKAPGIDPNYKRTYFKFSGVPSSPEICLVSSNGIVSYVSDGNTLTQSSYGDNSTRLLAVIRNTSTDLRKYRMFDNNGAGFTAGNVNNPYPIDLTSVTETLPTKIINVSTTGFPYIYLAVWGVRNNGGTPEHYYINDYTYPSSMGRLFVPDLPNLFDSYLYSTSFIINKHSHTIVKSSPDFDALQPGIMVKAKGAGAVTFGTTGNYDHGIVSFDTPDGSAFWQVYVSPASGTRTVTCPKLPVEVLEKITRVPFGSLTFTRFTALDFKDIEGFQDFIQKRTSITHLQERRMVIVNAEDIGG